MFKQQYNNSTVQTRLKAQFYDNQQTLTENSVNFINAKLKAHKRLFPNQSENDSIEDLIQLLHPQVQVHLLQTPMNVDDLSLKLEVIDKAQKLEPEKTKPFNKSENSKPYSLPEKPFVPQKQYHSHTLSHEDKSQPKYPNFIPNCRFCPEKHFHRDCPVLKRSTDKREITSGNTMPNKSSTPTSHTGNTFTFQSKPINSRLPLANNVTPTPHNSQSTNIPLNNKPHVTQVSHPYVSPSLCIKLFNKYQPVMLDSGASSYFIESKQLPPNTPIHPCYDLDIVDVSGKTVNVIGQTPLSFSQGKHEYLEDFRIIGEISVPIILGISWFTKHRAILDFSRNVLIVGNSERENLPFLHRTLEQMRQVPTTNLEEVQHEFPDEYTTQFYSLLTEYADVFDTKILQQTTATEHHIILTSTKPTLLHTDYPLTNTSL